MSQKPQKSWLQLQRKELGTSSWKLITQEMITAFGLLTEDMQYLHVDPAMKNSRFGGTIAHGYLLLSLLPAAVFELTAEIGEGHTYLFGGHGRVNLMRPVVSGASVCYRLFTESVELVKPGMYRLLLRANLEVQGYQDPAIECDYIVYVDRAVYIKGGRDA